MHIYLTKKNLKKNENVHTYTERNQLHFDLCLPLCRWHMLSVYCLSVHHFFLLGIFLIFVVFLLFDMKYYDEKVFKQALQLHFG